jgi:hypothetical protein
MLEGLIGSLLGDKLWKIYTGDSMPLFQEQTGFKSAAFYRKYMIRTDKNQFLPDIFDLTFEYRVQDNWGAMKTSRKVIDFLAAINPEAFTPIIATITEENNGETIE